MKKYEMTEEEIASLLFYQGADLEKVGSTLDGKEKEFYQIKNGYEAINMLLFPGIENENTRLLSEGRTVNTILLDQIDELLEVYCNLYSAICKYTLFARDESVLHTYRYDRMQSLDVLQAGKIPSFFSTSTERKTSDYFKKKKGLLIFEVEATSDTVHLDLNNVLGKKSAYSHEKEILFPPYAKVVLKEMEMTEEELNYRDREGNPPVGKYNVHVSNNQEMETPIVDNEMVEDVKNLLLEIIKDVEYLQNAREVWECYNRREKPDTIHIEKYMYWKKELQTYIRLRFREIYQNIFYKNVNSRMDHQSLLIGCIKETEAEANRKREEYERELFWQSIVFALFRAIAVFFIALSLLDFENCGITVKVLAVGFSVVSFFLREIFKGMALGGKVKQRTVTFLRLDELRRDIFFEKTLSEEKLDLYIERYKQIIREDNLRCEENAEYLTSLPDNLTKHSSKEIIDEIIKE